MSKLKLSIHTLESEKSDYEYNTQKLKSDYGIKVAILESENEFLQQNIDKLKRQISCAMKDVSQDEKVLLDKPNKKSNEILYLKDTLLYRKSCLKPRSFSLMCHVIMTPLRQYHTKLKMQIRLILLRIPPKNNQPSQFSSYCNRQGKGGLTLLPDIWTIF